MQETLETMMQSLRERTELVVDGLLGRQADPLVLLHPCNEAVVGGRGGGATELSRLSRLPRLVMQAVSDVVRQPQPVVDGCDKGHPGHVMAR